MHPNFENDILAMNARYKLADIDTASWIAVTRRLVEFKDILDKECAELIDIEILAEQADDVNWPEPLALKVKVELADLLGDIVVYCVSEAARWGIPIAQVLQLIMASNTSKLGADGQPIIDPSNGKFLKGPNYWKPEPAIEHLFKYGGEGMFLSTSDTGVVTIELIDPTYADTAAASQPSENEGE